MELTPWLSHYKTEFELARRQRRDPIRFDDLRCEALDRFLLLGFPTTRDKDWQFTDLTPVSETYFTTAADPARGAPSSTVSTIPRVEPPGVELVFVNGHYVRDLSAVGELPDGAIVAPLASVIDSNADDIERYFGRAAPVRHPAFFVDFNTALFHDGACIIVPPGAVVDEPIHLRFISTGDADAKPAMSHPRVLIALNDGSRATVVESHTGPDGIEYLTNAVTEIVLGEGASVDYYRLQHESTAAYHIAATHVLAGRHSQCSMHSLTLGGALVRNDIVTLLGGEHGKCTLTGLYLADGQQLVDNHTIIDHAMPNCASRQSYKGILGGEARGILGGTNIVRASAPKSQARQINQALVLSRDARMIAKPEVEMLAGAASFTLRSAVEQLELTRELRGKGRASPRAFTHAFARRALNRIRVPPLTSLVEELLERRLDRLLGSAPSPTP